MKLRVLPYVTVEIDDRLLRKVRRVGERFRLTVRAGVTDKIGPDVPEAPAQKPHLRVVGN